MHSLCHDPSTVLDDTVHIKVDSQLLAGATNHPASYQVIMVQGIAVVLPGHGQPVLGLCTTHTAIPCGVSNELLQEEARFLAPKLGV